MDNWINILIKSSALFIGSLFLVRIMGKKSLTHSTPFTFVNYIVVSMIVALIVTEVITNVAFGLVALGVWVIFPILIDLLSIKSKGFHDLIHGRETVLVKHGKIMEENLMDVRLTGEELLRELRRKNAFNVSDVEFAVLEATGDVHVFMKSEKNPITPAHLGIHVSPITEPQTVILDGVALNESLASLGKTPHWLKTELEKIGVSIDNVFLGQINSFGELYVDLFDDATKIPENTTRELLWANLEKCQADLLHYSLETQNEGAKNMYYENSKQLKELLKNLKPYLLA
jgi:uncharacterized membrane protein YcaP (DUF421 family)